MKKSLALHLLNTYNLPEKCPNTESFLVLFFPYSDRVRENTDQKKLCIWTLFTQWYNLRLSSKNWSQVHGNILQSHRFCRFLRQIKHCVKSIYTRSFFWSVFPRIRTEYGDLLRKFPYSIQIRENTDQKKLRNLVAFHAEAWQVYFHFLQIIFHPFCYLKQAFLGSKRIRNFWDFFFYANSIGSETSRLRISQTSELKSTKESVWDSAWYIHFDALYNYFYSFRKQPAANFFKNKNWWFHDQGT